MASHSKDLASIKNQKMNIEMLKLADGISADLINGDRQGQYTGMQKIIYL